MRFQKLVLIAISSLSILLAGCADGEPAKTTNNAPANKQIANSPRNTGAGNESADPIKPEETPVRKEINKAETLKPIVLAYCSAINAGDDAALRNIYSTASWRALSADAASEGKRSVARFLSESEPVGKICNVVNERISGPVAEAVVITETYPKGVPLKFVKESGKWKMTNQSSDFDAVRKSSKQ